VLFDCFMVNLEVSSTFPVHVPSAIRSCHFTGNCGGIVRHYFDLDDIESSRYFLEFACRVHDKCPFLYASYRLGYLPELYPGRFSELTEPTMRIRWDAFDWLYKTPNKRRFPPPASDVQ